MARVRATAVAGGPFYLRPPAAHPLDKRSNMLWISLRRDAVPELNINARGPDAENVIHASSALPPATTYRIEIALARLSAARRQGAGAPSNQGQSHQHRSSVGSP